MSLSFLKDPRVQTVLGTLEDQGFESLVVGGAARDGLRGIDPKDIDVATSATPDQVQAAFQNTQASLHPTGLEHGTWTIALDDMPIEVTTFRRDVTTDGRRATVAWADTFEEDAQRRDFTINALGITRTGDIKDPTGQGLTDLENGKVRFVGRAQDRCDEDALRVLRLFRFQGRMGSWPMDKEALEAARNTSLSHISGERIWSEMKGILQTPQAGPVLDAMTETGVWGQVLPKAPFNKEGFEHVARREESAGLEAHWGRRLVGATGRSRFPWPMSGAEARQMVVMDKSPYKGEALKAAAESGSAQTGLDAWCLGKGGERDPKQAAEKGATTPFPVSGKDLIQHGHTPGPSMGKTLTGMKQKWIESGLALTKDDLMPKKDRSLERE